VAAPGLLAADRKDSTVELYSAIMRTHVLPALGSVRFSRLAPGDVERLLAGMVRQRSSRYGRAGERVSGVTRRRLHSAVPHARRRDPRRGRHEERVPRRGPAQGTHAGVDYLTPAQVRGVLDALRGQRIEPIVLLLATTGVRIGEALALRWTDLDLDQGLLRVTGTVRVVGGKALRTFPKAQRGRRTLPLTKETVALLTAWKARQSAERLRAGTSWAPTEEWVFTTETGRLLDQRNAARAYQRALRRAELQGVPARFHILRHSVASAMLAEGRVSVRTASEILGHASTSITADTCAHVAQDAKRMPSAGELPPGGDLSVGSGC
jgi:integrase